ncbi:MAG: hypothetical protein JNM79_23555 [Burkholderiales bacterium]|nr:hypothetical protein [Burkholderiales bacterium]
MALRRPGADVAAAVTTLLVTALMYGVFTNLRVPSGTAAIRPAALAPISAAVAADPRPARAGFDSVSAAVYENHRQGQALVAHWARTLAQRDPNAHVALYSSSFRAGDGSTRPVWESNRRKSVLFAERIPQSVRDLRIEHVSPERLVAHFVFGDHADAQRVSLVLVREGASWRIAAETTETPATQAG